MSLIDIRQVLNGAAPLGLITVFTTALKSQETLNKIMNAYPYFEPFLFPLLMGALVTSGFYAIFAVPPAIRSLFPGVIWGRKFYQRCEDLSFKIAPIIGFDSKNMSDLMIELRMFCADLEQYDIRYPPISERYRIRGDNRVDSVVKLWREYLLILRTCTQQGDLERAQNIFDELSIFYQKLWERLEEAEEARAENP